MAEEPRVADPAAPAAATHVQVLTPLAAGAIAVVQVVGPQALPVAGAVFRPRRGQSLADYPPNHLAYGDLLDADGAVLDDGLALWGRSPDGRIWVEFNLHGGVRIVQRLIRRLAGLGARFEPPASPGQAPSSSPLPGDLQDQAFGWLCPLDRWVRACLPEAATPRVVQWLTGQGILWRQMVAQWRERLVSGDPDPVRMRAEGLLRQAGLGSLWRGRTLAIVGPPNAGKSSIANRLAGQGVSLVADSPGTTRDWVGQQIALSGWPVFLVDTAGLRATEDPIEAEGVARAIAQARLADVRLFVVDSSCGPSDSESWLVGQVGLKSTDIIAYSKCDLPAGRHPHADGLGVFAADIRMVQVSPLTGTGWSGLERALVEGSGLSALQEPQSLVFCEEVKRALVRLVSALDAREQDRALAVLDDLAPVAACDP